MISYTYGYAISPTEVEKMVMTPLRWMFSETLNSSWHDPKARIHGY
jgi:hypothetical protein